MPGVTATDERFPVLKKTHEPPLSGEGKIHRKPRLVQSVKEYWQTLVDADYEKAFGLMDLFYGAYSNKMVFGALLSTVRYLKCQTVEGSIKIHDNIATLKIKATIEAPNLMREGKNVSFPKRESEPSEKWLWVEGDWY